MSLLKVLLCFAFGFVTLFSTVSADCAKCSSASYAACINETAFLICYDGLTPSTQTVSCPPDTVCTDLQGVCKTKDPSVVVGCNIRSKCNECLGKFACVSQTEFAFCDSTGAKGVIASCGPGKYCNINEFQATGQICALSCATTPTCPNEEVVTDPPPVLDWKESCNSVPTRGFYKNIHDSTCKSYVYCEELNGVMNALLYTCAPDYFNSASQSCTSTKPSGCT